MTITPDKATMAEIEADIAYLEKVAACAEEDSAARKILSMALIYARAALSRPAPMPDNTGAYLKLECTRCHYIFYDSNDMSTYTANSDSSGAHEPLDNCPQCGGDARPLRTIAPAAEVMGGWSFVPEWALAYDTGGNVLYLTSPDNRPARGIEMDGGVVFRFAEDDGALVGITLLNPPTNIQSGMLVAQQRSLATPSPDAGRVPEDEAVRYQKIAGEQGTLIIRLRLALKVARVWGVHSEGYNATVSYELSKWIDAGANEPLPYFEGAFFNKWATEQGLSNCNGKLGYKLTVALAASPAHDEVKS